MQLRRALETRETCLQQMSSYQLPRLLLRLHWREKLGCSRETCHYIFCSGLFAIERKVSLETVALERYIILDKRDLQLHYLVIINMLFN